MICFNLNDPRDGGAYRSRDTLVLSGPIRTKRLFSWIRLEIRTSHIADMNARCGVRKVGAWDYQRSGQ